MIGPKKVYAGAILWIAVSLLQCVGIAQSLQYHVVSANEWLYPDSTIPVPPLHVPERACAIPPGPPDFRQQQIGPWRPSLC